MKLLVRKAIVAPGIVAAVTLLAWAAEGPRFALGVLAAGALAILVRHLYYLDLLTRWAAGPLDAPVPEARGVWADVFTAMYRRTRIRAAMQRELKHLVERFRRAADALPEGVVVLDAQNRIDWVNPTAMDQLGLAMPHDRGQAIVNLVRAPEFLRYVERGDFGEPVVVASLRDRRTLALQLVPFGLDEKLLLSRDVTQLEAVTRMRRDFIANVSHELKTPLTVISGFVETLQDIELEPRQRGRYLALMQDQAHSMRRLVEDLLTLSALESEDHPPRDDAFAVAPLLLELSADAKALSRGEHAVTVDIGQAAAIHGSRDELKSGLGNLVSNAVRYTPAGGEIRLSWRIDEDGSGVFAVADSGIGIAAEHIPRLTERFYRVDRSRSRATGGTGLGLAIVKHVLLRHHAELVVASTPGKGSTFSVKLPARVVEAWPVAPSLPDADYADATSTSSPPGTST
jgi:two-component system phosphate regulon sensor histidine kinase PhoR